jgi:Dna[CI] antecedent DciA-like protein
MLTKLGTAIVGWRPSAGPPGDPLATIRAAWADIVGDDVARAAQPVALTGTALVVVTASGAWSHQLSFLEREIIRSVVALGVPSVERLRFRIGTIRSARGAGGRRLVRPASSTPAAGKPLTAADAVARFRTVIERRRNAHRAAGGAFCATCGGAIAAGDRCRPCADGEEREQREQCERIMFEAPWLGPEDVLQTVVGLTPEAYDRIRRRLLRAWVDELRLARKRHAVKAEIDRVRIRKLASSYVLLETRIDPNRLELDSPVRRNALGDLYAFIREVETGN